MKIIKTEWFVRRKYSGWGITPVRWQGFAFLAVLVLPIFFIAPSLANSMSVVGAPFISISLYLAFVVSVVFYIMIKINVDEREKAHEAISDRNALWAMLFVIVIGVLAESISPEYVHGLYSVNPFMISAVVIAWITKVISVIYLDRTE